MREERIRKFQTKQSKEKKEYVIYWMQATMRVKFNHALILAIEEANRLKLPLLVVFGLTQNYPYANDRNMTFLLEGLQEVEADLKKLNVTFLLKKGSPVDVLRPLLYDAESAIMDFGYSMIQKVWRRDLILEAKQNLDINLYMVESDLFVPVGAVSDKLEYAARTIRPKLNKKMRSFCDINGDVLVCDVPYEGLGKSEVDLSNIAEIVAFLKIDHTVHKSPIYVGGYQEAIKHLNNHLDVLVQNRPVSKDPADNETSKLSMYLHFGQISPLEIYYRTEIRTIESPFAKENIEGFLEQLLVRRELAFNFVYYQKGYNQFGSMTDGWAYQTMLEHELDKKEYIYTKEDYLSYQTHDPYFNACMKEMVQTGFMHNVMRMYWGKKIIEWSDTYQEAYDIMKELNDTYFIDGRDPNSYAGIAWCFGKHDRAFSERAIFGKLRYMNSAGLKRKYKIEEYVQKWLNNKQEIN